MAMFSILISTHANVCRSHTIYFIYNIRVVCAFLKLCYSANLFTLFFFSPSQYLHHIRTYFNPFFTTLKWYIRTPFHAHRTQHTHTHTHTQAAVHIFIGKRIILPSLTLIQLLHLCLCFSIVHVRFYYYFEFFRKYLFSFCSYRH